jgi:hypothetical protein
MSTMMQHAGHGLGLGLGLGPDRWPRPLRDDLAYIRTGIVNLYLVGPEGAGDRGWVLVDAGLIGSIGAIEGPGPRPSS